MKRRLKIWPVIILLVCIILIVCIISIVSSLKSKKTIKNEVIDTIEAYNYNLKENESSYYKELFKELKEVLSKKKVDKKEYASTISKLFITDLLSLDNAINKNDIGGTEFVYEDYRETFITKAKDTLYLNIESNIYGDRKQELPVVTKVKIINVENKSYNSQIVKDKEAFYVECEVEYKKDLKYPKKVELVLVNNGTKLEIVSME